jgi:hypothetical protein
MSRSTSCSRRVQRAHARRVHARNPLKRPHAATPTPTSTSTLPRCHVVTPRRRTAGRVARSQCILSGADAYLLKPLRVHELKNIWQYVWRRRHEVQLMQQVSALGASGRHGAPMPNLQGATKVKGSGQRLTKDRVPELMQASRQLDRLELVSTKQAQAAQPRTAAAHRSSAHEPRISAAPALRPRSSRLSARLL